MKDSPKYSFPLTLSQTSEKKKKKVFVREMISKVLYDSEIFLIVGIQIIMRQNSLTAITKMQIKV